MLIAAGGGRGLPLDYDELERWTRIGFERGCGHERANAELDAWLNERRNQLAA
jgi:hypothetical protein